MREIHLVKKLISLLLISVCLGDSLILKDKTVYTGTLIKFGSDEIMFKYFPPYSLRSKNLTVILGDIKELQLSDGTSLIENGIKVATNEKYIENTSYDRYLFVLRAEKYKNSAERAKERKSIYVSCCLIIILFGFLAYKNFTFDMGFPDGPWPGDGASIEG